MSFAANAESVALPKTPPESSDDAENAKPIELEDRLVAEQVAPLQEQAMLEKKKDLGQLKGSQTTDPLTSVVGNASQCEDSNLPERGIHSLTHSVTDELSRPISEVENDAEVDESATHSVTDKSRGPISEVEDDAHVDESAEVCSQIPISVSPPPAEQKEGSDLLQEDHSVVRGSELKGDHFEGAQKRGWDLLEEDHNVVRGSELEGDDFEGADGEIDSVSGGQSREPLSEDPKRRISSPDGRLRDRDGKEVEEEDGEVIQADPELQDDLRTTEAKLNALKGHQYPLNSDSEELSANQHNLEAKETDSGTLNLGTLSTKTQDEDADKASTHQSRLDSEISLLYPQQLDPEDVINPFSLEVRIRKAREQQDIALEWGAETIAENMVGTSQSQLDFEETNRSILPDLEEISPDQRTGSSDTAVENGFYSEVKKRIGMEPPPPEHLFEENVKDSSKNKTGMGEAVLLGALASGVNKPTWFVIRAVLVGLLASLLLLLQVALKSGSWFVLLNVLLLISIAGGLIILLRWYISEIGLVSVDKQMAELNLTSDPRKVESKTQ